MHSAMYIKHQKIFQLTTLNYKWKHVDGNLRRMPLYPLKAEDTCKILLLFFQMRENTMLFFKHQYKQKFTHWLWKKKNPKPRIDTFASLGTSLALLSLVKHLWTSASCCSLAFFNCISLAVLYLTHWACSRSPFLLPDSNLFCDNHRVVASEGTSRSRSVVCISSRWARWSQAIKGRLPFFISIAMYLF